MNQWERSSAKPSFSIPTECVFTYQLPACQATCFVGTICVTNPSLERIT